MATYLLVNNRKLFMPSEVSFNATLGCDTYSRKMLDGTKTSYAINLYQRPQAKTFSLAYSMSYRENANLIQHIYNLDDIVGKNADLYYCDTFQGKVIIESVNTSISVDATTGIQSIQVGIQMKESKVITMKAVKNKARML